MPEFPPLTYNNQAIGLSFKINYFPEITISNISIDAFMAPPWIQSFNINDNWQELVSRFPDPELTKELKRQYEILDIMATSLKKANRCLNVKRD
jgi:hypothetical protein